MKDGAFLQSFKWLYSTINTEKDHIIKICSSWKPYSTLASRYLYIALDSGLTKEKINIIEERRTSHNKRQTLRRLSVALFA